MACENAIRVALILPINHNDDKIKCKCDYLKFIYYKNHFILILKSSYVNTIIDRDVASGS